MKLRTEFRLRIRRGDDIAVGPGKIDLLEAIDAAGSITAAARSLGMSYRRAWLLVDTMNRCFRTPVVEAEAGGKRGGGARLTRLGRDVIKPTAGSNETRRAPARQHPRVDRSSRASVLGVADAAPVRATPPVSA
jgi:molybdate transport system regulatory protein